MSAPVLVLTDVSVGYERDQPLALSHVSLSLSPGERVAVLGLNGSGKTTLLHAVAGLVPHEGYIAVCGTRLTPRAVGAVRDRVGLLFGVPEDQLLFPTVLDDVAFGPQQRGASHEEATRRARSALLAVGLEDLSEAPLHRLSHGQKQRVALAGVLVVAPAVLLLDEPSAALDPVAKRGLVEHLVETGATALIATHDLPFADRLCHRFVLLERGRVVAEGADVRAVEQMWDEPGRSEGSAGRASR